MLKITVWLSLLLLVKSQSIKWTANFGKQYPGITPLLTRLDDHSIAIASLLQDSNRTFHLLVQRYSTYGKLEAKCDLIIPSVSKRIWDLKMQHTSESFASSVAFSWLYNDGMELGIRVLEVNVTGCSLGDTKLPLYHDLDLVLYVPYYLMPRGDGGFFLFVKSPEICEGICRLNVGHNTRLFGQNDGTFITARDDSLVWRLVAVNSEDLSQGYYYISENAETGSVKVEKLNSSGTLLRSRLISQQQQHQRDDSNISVSNSHARLGMCWSANCFLLDSDTFQSRLNVSVTRNVSAIVNTVDSLIIIHDDNTVTKLHENHDTNENQLGMSIELFRGFDELNCYPRKMYEGFEMANNLYCTGRPCMRKANSSEVFYQVSVSVECDSRIL